MQHWNKTDPMERQQQVQFYEQTAALAGVLMIVLAVLDLTGIFEDQNLYLLLLFLGAFMNGFAALRDHLLSRRVLMGVEGGAAVISLLAFFYLLL